MATNPVFVTYPQGRFLGLWYNENMSVIAKQFYNLIEKRGVLVCQKATGFCEPETAGTPLFFGK